MNDVVNAAIAAALAAGNNTPSTAVANSNQAPLPVGKPRSLADAVASAGTSCDEFIKVKDTGIYVGDDLQAYDNLLGTMKLSACKFPWMVRFNLGGVAQYCRSYDGIREARSGKAWADVVAEACRVDSKCQGQYDAVEFVLTLTEDLKGKTKVWPKGTTLGHTTAITGTKTVMSYITEASQRGANDNDAPVVLEHKPMKKGQFSWGVMTIADAA